jgi:maleylacetoacetate isomerase
MTQQSMQEPLILYTYWRSSAAFRVRIGLHLKGLAHQDNFVHLVKDGGEQHLPAFTALNPQGLIPVLQVGPVAVSQSLAILEYLDEVAPEPRLLPGTALERARIRSLALAVACDIHPINNLRVGQHLGATFGADAAAKVAWMQHWMQVGFSALEARLAAEAQTGLCCHGDTPTLADVCLIPQCYNALRFGLDLQTWPTLARIFAHCRILPAFAAAWPEAQPDVA